MGKPTGFLDYQRLSEASEPVDQRLKHYREFVLHLSDEEAKIQGARCMDCGIPFCNNGCPVHNIIPDWNDFVFRGQWQEALDVLHSTNNFPDFTGRVCPAPCESACTLNINGDAVGIKSIEHAIIDKGWEMGWVVPQPAKVKTGKKVAIIGSGPAGLATAQQLARAGHDVTVFEKNDRIGGLLRYGIPDFKLDKSNIDRRVKQMEAEGVKFRTSTFVGRELPGHGITNLAKQIIAPETLVADYDAVVLAAGSEVPRDLPAPGRDLEGVHFAMEFLPQQNRVVSGDTVRDQISAKGKHVLVIGGGDTGSDCVGTSNRQGAANVVQIELLAKPPVEENKPQVWPYWPIKLRTSSSHEEGCERDWGITTKEFIGGVGSESGKLKAVKVARVEWKDGKMVEVPGSEFEIQADLVFLAMGFVNPLQGMLDAFGVAKDHRNNARAEVAGEQAYRTSAPKVFAAGDVRRGQSLIVWAIREGRQCARAVDEFLMGASTLPR